TRLPQKTRFFELAMTMATFGRYPSRSSIATTCNSASYPNFSTDCQAWKARHRRPAGRARSAARGRARRFARNDAQRETLVSAQHNDVDAIADQSPSEQPLQVVDAMHWRLIQGDDDVADAQSGGGCWRVGF